MKAKSVRTWMCVVLTGFAVTASNSVFADSKAPPPKKAAAPQDPPTAAKPITVSPASLTWGIGTKQVAAIYDKVIDDDYKDKYKKVQPGPAMDDLDAEVAEKKSVFRRSIVNFDDVPTGLDNSPLHPEYTYNNKEAMMRLTRNGKTRDFFFIQNKLWKIIDELPVGESSTWGKDFTEVATGLATYYGVAGLVRDPDATQYRAYTEVVWRDSSSLVRAVDWQNGKFGLAFQDIVTTGQLSSLRTGKQPQDEGIDPTVKDIMHTPSAPPEKPKPDDKTKK